MVGTGPGPIDLMSLRAVDRIKKAQVVTGYKTYLDLIPELLAHGQEIVASGMMQEVDRCRKALELAEKGKSVALVCGGDPGIYAMAGLVFEIARSKALKTKIEIIPGIPALSSCAAVLGAPVMHDFAAVSLSDLLTPWDVIESRLQHAAKADFVIVIYNPASKKRRDHIKRAAGIILEHRRAQTPAGIVTGAFRKDQSIQLTTLGRLAEDNELSINMQSTVIVGNSRTFSWQGKMVTPRGYENKYTI